MPALDQAGLGLAAQEQAALFGSLKLIAKADAVRGAIAAGDYFFANNGTLLLETTDSASTGPIIVPILAADLAVAGRTTKLVLKATLATNATAPAITYTVGLFPITAVAGAANNIQATLGPALATLVAAFATPGASAVAPTVTSPEVALPADGAYALGVTASGSATANAFVAISASLFAKYS